MLQNLINKIRRCDCWNTLYSLAEEFKKYGLSIEHTNGGRHALCRLENGQPVVESILDDFIFIEGTDAHSEISPRAMEVITDFTWRCATKAQTTPELPAHKRRYSLYGKPIRIHNENQLVEEQEIRVIGRLITE